MKPVSYFNMKTGEGKDLYVEKAHANVALFDKILGHKAEFIGNAINFPESGPNYELLCKIKDITGLSMATIKGINVADEIMNINGTNQFGCTSVGAGHRIGQTMDLFSLDLAIVHEEDALYVTMPPYLCLMGIGKHVAFVTNFLSGPVRTDGTPISHMRRELLRRKSASDVCFYLHDTIRSNSVNFLVVDDKDLIDIEVSKDQMIIHDSERVPELIVPGKTQGRAKQEGYLAHTNHFVQRPFTSDTACPRLCKANELLRSEKSLEEILDDKALNLPVLALTDDYGFGTIIQVVMDIKDKSLKFKDPTMSDWKVVSL